MRRFPNPKQVLPTSAREPIIKTSVKNLLYIDINVCAYCTHTQRHYLEARKFRFIARVTQRKYKCKHVL